MHKPRRDCAYTNEKTEDGNENSARSFFLILCYAGRNGAHSARSVGCAVVMCAATVFLTLLLFGFISIFSKYQQASYLRNKIK